VDERRVEEILGVPPEKSCGFTGDAGDTIGQLFPAQRGVGEKKGAAEVDPRRPGCGGALDHADECPINGTGSFAATARDSVIPNLGEICQGRADWS